MSLKTVIRNIGLVGVTEIINSASGIILVAILTKFLGIYSYGLWEQVAVTIGILDPFASFGLNNALIRFLPVKKLKTEKQDLFYSILLFKLITSLIISLVLILFSGHLANAFFGGNIEIVRLISVIFIIGSATVVCQFYLQSVSKIKLYSLLKLSGRIVEIVSIFITILLGYDLIGVLLAVIIVRAIFLIIYFFFIISDIGITIPHFTEIKELLRYGLPLVPTGFSAWVITFSDRYMIAYMMGVSYVGSYSVGYTIGFIIFMLVVVINFVLMPVLSKMYDEHNMNEVKQYLKYSLKYYLFFSIPTVFGLSILSKQLLTIIATSSVAEEAWIIPPIIALAALFAGVYETFEKSLRLTKKTKIIGVTVTISAMINFLLNLFFIPLMGITGAALATVSSYGVATALIIFYSFKEIRFEIEKKFFPKAISASILIVLIAWIWQPVGLISVILCIFVCIISYFVIMFLLKVFEPKEIAFIKNLVKIW